MPAKNAGTTVVSGPRAMIVAKWMIRCSLLGVCLVPLLGCFDYRSTEKEMIERGMKLASLGPRAGVPKPDPELRIADVRRTNPAKPRQHPGLPPVKTAEALPPPPVAVSDGPPPPPPPENSLLAKSPSELPPPPLSSADTQQAADRPAAVIAKLGFPRQSRPPASSEEKKQNPDAQSRPILGGPITTVQFDENVQEQSASPTRNTGPEPQRPALAPGQPAGSLQALAELAEQSNSRMNAYIVRFRRRERIGGRTTPEEIMLMKFRSQPWSLYLKWIGRVATGRELTYVPGHYGNLVHLKLAAGDVPFFAAGSRTSLAPNSPMLTARSRHSISEIGLGNAVRRFVALVEANARGDYRGGRLRYLGLVRRPEFREPVEAVMQSLPPATEPGLAKGGRRYWYFDTRLRLPVLMILEDHQQGEVEYYCYDRFRFPDRLYDDDFNPDLLFGR